MTSTRERDELRRLVDELPDEAVHNVLEVARVAASGSGDDPDQVPKARRARPAWIGAGRLGPDFASRAKDVLLLPQS